MQCVLFKSILKPSDACTVACTVYGVVHRARYGHATCTLRARSVLVARAFRGSPGLSRALRSAPTLQNNRNMQNTCTVACTVACTTCTVRARYAHSVHATCTLCARSVLVARALQGSPGLSRALQGSPLCPHIAEQQKHAEHVHGGVYGGVHACTQRARSVHIACTQRARVYMLKAHFYRTHTQGRVIALLGASEYTFG